MEHLSSVPPPKSGLRRIACYGRRASRRVPLHAGVVVLEPARAEGVTINASQGGLRIAVDQPLEVGFEHLLQITFDSGEVALRRARVVWSRVLPDGCIAGVAFVAPH